MVIVIVVSSIAGIVDGRRLRRRRYGGGCSLSLLPETNGTRENVAFPMLSCSLHSYCIVLYCIVLSIIDMMLFVIDTVD
jgi:hypothetical protein